MQRVAIFFIIIPGKPLTFDWPLLFLPLANSRNRIEQQISERPCAGPRLCYHSHLLLYLGRDLGLEAFERLQRLLLIAAAKGHGLCNHACPLLKPMGGHWEVNGLSICAASRQGNSHCHGRQ